MVFSKLKINKYTYMNLSYFNFDMLKNKFKSNNFRYIIRINEFYSQ